MSRWANWPREAATRATRFSIEASSPRQAPSLFCRSRVRLLDDAADAPGEEGDERHVEGDEAGGEERGAVVAGDEVDPAGELRAEERGERLVRRRARPVEEARPAGCG